MRTTILALCLCLSACSGAQKVPTAKESDATAAEPTAQDLEECPCGDGRADWSELPPGSDPAEPE